MKYAIGLYCLCLVATTGFADVKQEDTYTYDLGASGRVDIENVNGSIEVSGGDFAEVSLKVIKEADDQEDLDDIIVKLEQDGDTLFVDVEYPSKNRIFGWGSNNNSGEVSFELTVPRGTRLQTLDTVNGSVQVSGVNARMNIDTVNGSIKVSDITDSVDLDTVNGSITARFDTLEGAQKAVLDTTNGRITAYLPEAADVRVSADTVHGGIRTGGFGLDVEKELVGSHLDGELGNGSARLKMDTTNGSITLKTH